PQSPNPKRQRNPKLQTPNGASIPRYWSLELGASLGFGFWDLDFSFIAQRLHRIDFHRPSRREPAGEQSSGDEQHRDGSESEWIGRADTKKQTAQKARQHHRSDQTEHYPRACQLETTPQHEGQHRVPLRAQRHANTNLASALSDGPGNHSVNPDHCEKERSPGEERHH